MSNKGFTLLEFMIVVAVVGILAALAVPKYQDMVTDQKTRRDSRNIYSLIQSARILAAKEGQDVFIAFGDPKETSKTEFTKVLMGLDSNNDGLLTDDVFPGVANDDIRERLDISDLVKADRGDKAVGQIQYNSRGFLASSVNDVVVKVKNREGNRAYRLSINVLGAVNFSCSG